MRFLRTASTGRLLAVIVGLVVAIAAGTAIAVAAAGSGPVPKRESLATAVHSAAKAPSVKGISADITFTNNLIGASDFQGGPTDPLLQGATGRLWLSNDRPLPARAAVRQRRRAGGRQQALVLDLRSDPERRLQGHAAGVA